MTRRRYRAACLTLLPVATGAFVAAIVGDLNGAPVVTDAFSVAGLILFVAAVFCQQRAYPTN